MFDYRKPIEPGFQVKTILLIAPPVKFKGEPNEKELPETAAACLARFGNVYNTKLDLGI